MRLQRLQDDDSQFGEHAFRRLLKFCIAQPA
jgi:hypothetical protein